MLIALLKRLLSPPAPAPTATGFFQAAEAAFARGAADEARRSCERALALRPDYLECHLLMSRIALPGPPYREVLSHLHRLLNPRTYFEVGVSEGSTLALVLPQTRAIGVDPEPRLKHVPGPNVTVHRVTSDAYFAAHDVRAELGGLPVDLGFIDGMHQFEFALRDFINLERHCTRDSTLVVHDVYPLDRLTAERERRTPFWTGDIWRLVLILKKYRPDLTVATVATSPSGLAVVRRLDPESRVLGERYEDIVAEFAALDYGVLEADKAGALNLYPNDYGAIGRLVGRS